MSENTISDALARDLRALFLADEPLTTALDSSAVRLQFEITELPSPRLVFIGGDPVRIPGQDGTSRVPFEVRYITSLDRVAESVHHAVAAEVDAWLREIRISKRRGLIDSRVWLHDLYSKHPVYAHNESREQVTTMRGEAIVTLAVTTPA